MSKINGTIYKFTNMVNGKVYIGQTVRPLVERVSEHMRNKKSLISKAINKYGIENFSILIIDKAYTIEDLNRKEDDLVKLYNCISPLGYNLCNGGGNTMGYHYTDECRLRMSISKKGKYTGEENHFYGKTHTNEIKLLFSKQRTGRKETKEWIEHKREANFKKVINLDTLEIFISVKEAAKKYNVQDTNISKVCNGKRKLSGGCRWLHYDEWIQINKVNEAL